MRIFALAAVMLFCAGVASAEIGRGGSPYRNSGILVSVDAPPLDQIDRDAARFSIAPTLGGRAYIMTFVGAADGAWAEIIWLRGHPRLGWEVTRRQRLELEPSEYEYVASAIDDAFKIDEPSLNPDPDTMIVCTDAPSVLTERLMDGDYRWITDSCGDDHPNDFVTDFLTTWLLDRLGDE